MRRRPLVVQEPEQDPPLPYFADLPPYAQPKPDEMVQLEAQAQQLQDEGAHAHEDRQRALEDDDLAGFHAHNARIDELPGVLADVHAELLAYEMDWLSTHVQPLREFMAPHIDRLDELFAEQQRITAEILARQTVLNEADGRLEDVGRRTRIARRRRQEVMRAQLVQAAGLVPASEPRRATTRRWQWKWTGPQVGGHLVREESPGQ